MIKYVVRAMWDGYSVPADQVPTCQVIEQEPQQPRKTGLVDHLGREIMSVPDPPEPIGFKLK